MEKIRIAYFGTPEFAASQLEAILKAGYEVAVVVTMPRFKCITKNKREISLRTSPVRCVRDSNTRPPA